MMLEREEEIVKQLIEKYPGLQDSCKVTRARRIFVDVPKDDIAGLAAFVKGSLGFQFLVTITGLDAGEDFQLIYHFANDEGIILNVKVNAPKSDPAVETVTRSYEGGVLYEIEVRNLLGVDIRGIPADIRYPLPDGWPDGQYPLRKDWVPASSGSGQEGECQNG